MQRGLKTLELRMQRLAMEIPDNMIRVACGIENPEDLGYMGD